MRSTGRPCAAELPVSAPSLTMRHVAVSAARTRAAFDMQLEKLHRAGSRRFLVDPCTCLLASCFTLVFRFLAWHSAVYSFGPLLLFAALRSSLPSRK